MNFETNSDDFDDNSDKPTISDMIDVAFDLAEELGDVIRELRRAGVDVQKAVLNVIDIR